jgi:gas vesicle protein
MTRSRHAFRISFLSAAIGAGLALLFAPQTGEKTRRQIRQKAKTVKDFCEDVQNNAQDLYSRGAVNARRFLKRVA